MRTGHITLSLILAAGALAVACNNNTETPFTMATGGAVSNPQGGAGNLLMGGSAQTLGGANQTTASGGTTQSSSSGGTTSKGGSTGQGGGTTTLPGTGGKTTTTTGGAGATTSQGGTTTGGTTTSGGTVAKGGTSSIGGTSTAAGATGKGGGGGTAPAGGYYKSDPLKGYVWTAVSAAGATVTPANFGTVTTQGPYCASGTVNKSTDSSSVAMVGINVNQIEGTDTPVGTWTPTGSGLLVNVTNTGSSALRVQIQTPNGGTVATERWCAPISQFNQDVLIPWDGFNTECWTGGKGTIFNGTTPISAVLVMVPGGTTADVPFNYCVNSVKVSSSTSTGTGGSGGGGTVTQTGSGTVGNTAGLPADATVQRNSKNYVVQANVWGGNAQEQATYKGTSFKVTQQTGSNTTSAGPVSYPSVFIGSNFNRSTTGSNLPKLVSSLGIIDTGWNWASNGATGEYNASYDVWFSTSGGGDSGAPSGGYLMVWYYKPANAVPIGSQVASASVAGKTWNIWYGNNASNGKPCVSYVAASTINNYSFDLNVFIKDAVARNYVQNSWYLTNVFAGYEIWSGGVGLETLDWWAVVN